MLTAFTNREVAGLLQAHGQRMRREHDNRKPRERPNQVKQRLLILRRNGADIGTNRYRPRFFRSEVYVFTIPPKVLVFTLDKYVKYFHNRILMALGGYELYYR
jgi:hypothetical protein